MATEADLPESSVNNVSQAISQGKAPPGPAPQLSTLRGAGPGQPAPHGRARGRTGELCAQDWSRGSKCSEGS